MEGIDVFTPLGGITGISANATIEYKTTIDAFVYFYPINVFDGIYAFTYNGSIYVFLGNGVW
jgi:hypothetical protein